MLKKISTIFLSILCLASLCVGIMFSACPVIPYVKYQYAIEASNTKTIDTLIFHPKKNAENYLLVYTGESSSKRSLMPKTYTCDSNKLFLMRENDSYRTDGFTICNHKKELSSPTGNIVYKAKFNPTFIFYLVSAGALAGIIAINIPKKKKDE